MDFSFRRLVPNPLQPLAISAIQLPCRLEPAAIRKQGSLVSTLILTCLDENCICFVFFLSSVLLWLICPFWIIRPNKETSASLVILLCNSEWKHSELHSHQGDCTSLAMFHLLSGSFPSLNVALIHKNMPCDLEKFFRIPTGSHNFGIIFLLCWLPRLNTGHFIIWNIFFMSILTNTMMSNSFQV